MTFCDHSHMPLFFFFFFFLINNLLHGARWQTIVATFVTTYKGSTLTWEIERKKRKRKREGEKGI